MNRKRNNRPTLLSGKQLWIGVGLLASRRTYSRPQSHAADFRVVGRESSYLTFCSSAYSNG